MTFTDVGTGFVVRASELPFREVNGCRLARPVGPATGATMVTIDVVRVPPGHRWEPEEYVGEECTAVVFAGSGQGTVAARESRLSDGSALYAPTGERLAVTARTEVVLYIWRSTLLPGRPRGSEPKRIGSLRDSETQLHGFRGNTGLPESPPAKMNFVFWPGTGCAQLCLHCGVMRPGEAFNVHVHENSEEAFFAFSGTGQIFLGDRWVDVRPGDGIFAPPGIAHGARNHSEDHAAEPFVACGGPTPYDPTLYQVAGVSPDVV